MVYTPSRNHSKKARQEQERKKELKKRKKKETISGDGVREYSLGRNIFYVLGSAWKIKKSLPVLMLIIMLSEAADCYVPLLIVKFVIDGIEKKISIGSLLFIVGAAGALQLFMYVMKSIGKYQTDPRAFYVSQQWQIQRILKIHSMDYELLESQHMQDMISRSQDGVNGMRQMLGSLTRSGHHFFKMFFALVIIATASPLMILVTVLISVSRYVISDRTSKWIKENIDNKNVPARRKTSYYADVAMDFKYGKDIRLFQMADNLSRGQEKAQKEFFDRFCEGRRKWVRSKWAVAMLDQFLQTGIMYGWMICKVLFRGMSIGSFTLYIGSINRFGGVVAQLFSDYVNLREVNRRINDFRTFMEYPDTRQEKTLPLPQAEQTSFVFDHVWFRYPGHEEYVLKDICLTIQPGKRLAVVGPNGAGKSTFIKLLCRLYKPEKGVITVNGTNIWEVDQKDYFRLLAPVFQNVESYACSLAQNVSFRTLEETDVKRAEGAIREAGLGEKLDTLKNGAQTQLLRFLYEDGIDLSGGEKQKLSFARALYKGAKVFILDEPTAALDALAEQEMYAGFDRHIGGCTAVYISHRLSSTKFCHGVAFFEDGRIVEYGTHEDLMKKNGRYAHMYRIQARYYQEGGAAL